MTSRPLAFPDDNGERGKQAMRDAEIRLHARMMRDPHYAARQPTEADLAEYSRMDAAEEQARAAYTAVGTGQYAEQALRRLAEALVKRRKVAPSG